MIQRQAQYKEEVTLPQGGKGDPGLSAYELWLAAGNTGTVEQFLAGLNGQPGADGLNGTNATVNIGNLINAICTDGAEVLVDRGNVLHDTILTD